MSVYLPKVKKFIYGHDRNRWIPFLTLDVYMRKSHRVVEGSQIDCIDIASVEVFSKGEGDFTRFIIEVESIGYPVFIENILEERFANFFKGRGYLVKLNEDEITWFAFKFGKQVKWKW
jgi:hypothetical protein